MDPTTKRILMMISGKVKNLANKQEEPTGENPINIFQAMMSPETIKIEDLT